MKHAQESDVSRSSLVWSFLEHGHSLVKKRHSLVKNITALEIMLGTISLLCALGLFFTVEV